MDVEDLRKAMRERADELRRAYADRWPRMMRSEAVEHYRDGFRQGGFVDTGLERWDVTRRQSVPFNGAAGRYTPLNSRTGDLLHSIDGRIEPGAVVMFSSSDHARYHNEGATATVTPRMRRYFWAMHAEAKRRYGKDNPEALFWRGMATTKKRSLKIPMRKFMGRSAALATRISRMIEDDLRRILTTI